MNYFQTLVTKTFWLESFGDFFNDAIGFAVLSVACVLMLSYLRDKPPEFSKKRIICAGVVLCFGAFVSRSIAHFCSGVIDAETNGQIYKSLIVSVTDGHLPVEELLRQPLKVLPENLEITVDSIFNCAFCNLVLNGFNFDGLEYQKYVLIICVITTVIGFISICAGSFILMNVFKLKHVMPMAIVQVFGFLLRILLNRPYSELIKNLYFHFIGKELDSIGLFGYNGFAYGCFMIIMIISYILITQKTHESFWTKYVDVKKHILSFVVLFFAYTLLIVVFNYIFSYINEKSESIEIIFELMTNIFLTAVLLIVPRRTYEITRSELKNEFNEVERKEQVEMYEYSQEQSSAIRKFLHDLPMHFMTIETMASKINADNISQLINDLNTALIEARGEFSTGNTDLDDLLSAQLKSARKSDINIVFSGAFPNRGIKIKDMSTIFMNLIKNAVEACGSVSGKREISITSTIHEDRVYVTISNPFEHKTRKRRGRFETTKSNKKYHGYGIPSVKETVEKKEYDGSFSIKEEHNIFSVEIVMKFKH